MSDRTIITVSPVLVGWRVTDESRRIHLTQRQDAIDVGRLWGRSIECGGGKAQLIVRTRRGRISFENTYGSDPSESVG